ncbi:MAG: hypothetical protein P8129_04205 [Anaerolineae bacterium]
MSLNLDERSSQTGATPAEGPVPERMHLSLQREWGCIARFWSHFEVIREKEQATFYCRTQAHVPHLLPFQHDLPPAKFEALWRALQASEPAHWAAEYGQEQGIFSTGPLCGTLSLAYTLDGQAFSRTVQFLEDHFDDDAQMQQLYAYLVEFEEASLEFEAGQREATA